MNDPFKKLNVTMSISIHELIILIKTIQSTMPVDKSEEIVIYGLYAKFQRILEELE